LLLSIILNSFDDIGDFIIVTGEKPSKEFIEKELGIKNPEYVTIPFSDAA